MDFNTYMQANVFWYTFITYLSMPLSVSMSVFTSTHTHTQIHLLTCALLQQRTKRQMIQIYMLIDS